MEDRVGVASTFGTIPKQRDQYKDVLKPRSTKCQNGCAHEFRRLTPPLSRAAEKHELKAHPFHRVCLQKIVGLDTAARLLLPMSMLMPPSFMGGAPVTLSGARALRDSEARR